MTRYYEEMPPFTTVNAKEASKIIGVHEVTLLNWLNQENNKYKIPAIKLTGHKDWFINLMQLEDWIKNNPELIKRKQVEENGSEAENLLWFTNFLLEAIPDLSQELKESIQKKKEELLLTQINQ